MDLEGRVTTMSTSEIPKHFRKESPALQARLAGGLWWLCILIDMRTYGLAIDMQLPLQ